MAATQSTNWFKPIIGLLSGVLLWLCWPSVGFTPLIFIAWVPLLLAEQYVSQAYRYFFILLGSFFIWNIGATWWVWNSSEVGAIGAIVANSLLMCLPWMFYRIVKRRLGNPLGLLSLLLFWVTWEYIHHNWELSWPWLTLGNAFANQTDWIQWYQFTGTTGGTIWVLLINLLCFQLLNSATAPIKQKKWKYFLIAGLLFIPVWLSLAIKSSTPTVKSPYNIVVVQPNVDAYKEKFTTPPNILIQRMLALSESQIDSNTRLVVWPETAIPAQVWENNIEQNAELQLINPFLTKYPNVMLVTGIDSYKFLGAENPGGFTIRTMQDGNHYEAYNTAIAFQYGQPTSLYHKSKLVPGVESLPSWLGFMSSIFDGFGGISGSLGRSPEAKAFSLPNQPYIPAPIICYESVYGDYVTNYVRKGANVLTIITNDGWWGNTEGHRQHMLYARLRAIETGCWIARSANTGISCFIDPTGKIYQPQPWNTQSAIKMAIPIRAASQTFYVQHGDWLSIAAMVLAGIIVLLFAVTYLHSGSRAFLKIRKTKV